MTKWIERGRGSNYPESVYWRFASDVATAEAADPSLAAIRPYDDPASAWRFVERREPGYGSLLSDDPDGGSVITLRVDG